jgi:hypothetical protein
LPVNDWNYKLNKTNNNKNMALIEQREKKNYISILGSDATLRKVVPEGTLGAVSRTYKDKDEVEHTKIEKAYESVSGKITNISFVDTDYGTLLQVELTDPDGFLTGEGCEPEVLSMSTSQPFAVDFMKKLPNIDLSKEVVLKPFAFTPEGGKRELKGLTVTQEGNKIEKSFYDAEAKTNTMGFPNPDEKLATEKNEMKRKEGWKRYFKDVEIFLVDYTTENFVSKFDKAMVAEAVDDEMPMPEDY